jgi:septal ring factor EnvC (AmiA/AmiB activator)
MKRGRGRPPIYTDTTQQPALVALRIPRSLETRLRHAAAEQGRTMTDILLQALVAQWEHPHAAADLAETQAQLATLKRQYAALERKSDRLAQRRRTQAAADKRERARLEKERDQADAHVRMMHERLTVFTAANSELAEEIARRYAKVQDEAWRRRAAEIREEHARARAEINGRAGATSVPVKELIKLCHPDKWSQGQPATELAHEVMVRLTSSSA